MFYRFLGLLFLYGIIIFSVGILLVFTLHYLNRGEAVELSSHVEVGQSVLIPSSKGNLTGSYFPPPLQSGKHPAIVMVNGSGRTSYRTAWDPDKERYFWKPVTEMLHAAGYAVLLLEKRGINGSEGHWERESLENRADNVIAAVDFLKSQDGIDPHRIGLMGHSQGGWVVQLAAYKYPEDISFVVNLAGPSISVIEQVLDDYSSELYCEGYISEEINRKVQARRRIFSIYSSVSKFVKTGYLSRIIDYDPEPVTRALTVPIYSIYAENDHLVIPDHNIEPFTAGLREAGNDQYVVSIVPGANHHFFESNFCFDRSELRDKEPSEQFMQAMREFIEWEKEVNR